MNKLSLWKTKYETALSQINKTASDTTKPDLAKFVTMIMSYDINGYNFLPTIWGNSIYSAESFANLIQIMSHALYDDGDICFPVLNGNKFLIRFHDKRDPNVKTWVLEKPNLWSGTIPHITFLDSLSQFCDCFLDQQNKTLKKQFVTDAQRNFKNGILDQHIIDHYKKSSFWDDQLIDYFLSGKYIVTADQLIKEYNKVKTLISPTTASELFFNHPLYDQIKDKL